MVHSNPKAAFERYYKAGSWENMLHEEETMEENKDLDEDDREWLFSDAVLRKICAGRRLRHKMMIRSLIARGRWRYHPACKQRFG